MCEHKILHQSDSGCIIMCRQCETIRVLFSTISIDLTHEQFYEFKNEIAQYLEVNKLKPAEQRSIYIPTSVLSIHLLYSPNDLEELMTVLEDAYWSLEIEKLITE